MSWLTTLQSRAVELILIALLALTLGAGCWFSGAGHVQQQWDNERSQRTLAITTLGKKSAEISTQVVTEYVDRIKVIREAGQTLIKEIPVYVDQNADAACPVPDGFVWLWNGANRGQLPASARAADASAGDVVLSDIARQHGIEASQCRENEQQLTSLQGWIRQQEAAHAEAR